MLNYDQATEDSRWQGRPARFWATTNGLGPNSPPGSPRLRQRVGKDNQPTTPWGLLYWPSARRHDSTPVALHRRAPRLQSRVCPTISQVRTFSVAQRCMITLVCKRRAPHLQCATEINPFIHLVWTTLRPLRTMRITSLNQTQYTQQQHHHTRRRKRVRHILVPLVT